MHDDSSPCFFKQNLHKPDDPTEAEGGFSGCQFNGTTPLFMREARLLDVFSASTELFRVTFPPKLLGGENSYE